MPFTGCVLAGGQSRRFGSDKAFAELEGMPLVVRALQSISAADQTAVVGGDVSRLEALGVEVWADRWPGEGPLGGILSALEQAAFDDVVVFPTDAPFVDARLTDCLLEARRSTDADVAVPVAAGSPQWTSGAWARRSSVGLANSFARGERAVRRSLGPLRVVYVVVEGSVGIDVDTPDDLHEIAKSGA